MLSNEMDILEEIKAAILEPEPELKQIAELLKRSRERQVYNLTTGPVIKPVRFEVGTQNQQSITRSFVIFKALNNTNERQSLTVSFFNLAPFITDIEGIKTKDSCIQQPQKALFFSQTVEVEPQSTIFLPVDVTFVDEYEVQALNVPAGMYVATEFLPATPIPTAQAPSTAPNQNSPGAVIDSHIVNYSHQFVLLA